MNRLSYLLSTQPGGWADGNDDRGHADPARGLFYVGDASGPTYGGYYAPFGVDPALATFQSVFRCEEGDAAQRMRKALLAAHEHMRALYMTYEAEVARIHRSELDGLRASLQAADVVRPAAWERLRGKSFAHFASSLTACSIESNKLSVIQVGSNRAYRLRDGVSELLLLDHTLHSELVAEGKPLDTIPSFYINVVGSLLGISEDLKIREVTCDLQPGDRVLLCSDGIWAQEAGKSAISALLAATTQQQLDEVVTAVAGRCDATALLLWSDG